MRKSVILLILVLLSGCARPEQASSPRPTDSPRGHLFIVGGGPRPAPMMDRFVALAGGSGHARIVVIPLASAELEETGGQLVREMLGRGAASATSLILTRQQALDPSVARHFEGATGVWFAGGVQSRITDVMAGTPAEEAIRALYRTGAVIGGTSAGAAIMTTPMIVGDERRPGGSRPVQDDSWLTIERDNVVTSPGLDLFPGAIVDQHFVRRKRHNRLISLVLEHPNRIGLGIDEATALEVRPDGTWAVVGESVVVVYDARRADITPAGDVLGAGGLTFHVLPPGALFHPRTGSVQLPRAAPRTTASGDPR